MDLCCPKCTELVRVDDEDFPAGDEIECPRCATMLIVEYDESWDGPDGETQHWSLEPKED